MFYNTNSLDSDNILEQLELTDISEAYDFTPEGGAMIVAESEAAWNKIMEETAIAELQYVSRTGKELPINEGAFGDFIEKAKSFFKKLWEKVKEIFAKFMSYIDTFIRTNKSFVEKYSKMDLPDTVKINGYEFQNIEGYSKKLYTMDDIKYVEEIKALFGKNITEEEIDSHITKYDNDAKDVVRGHLCGQPGGVTASKFSETLFKYFRGSNTKTTKTLNVQDQLKLISDYNDSKKTAKDAAKEFQKGIKEIIKELESLSKEARELSDGDDGYANRSKLSTAAGSAVSFAKFVKTAQTTATTAHLKAMRDRKNQARAAVAKAARKTAENTYESNTESFSGGLLSGITLV